MSSEAQPPQANYAIASADLYMSAADHMELRSGIISTARESMLHRTPNSFAAELKNIPLRGTMPLEITAPRNTYRHMNYTAAKTQTHDPEDASVRIWITRSKERAQQLEFVSEKQAVEFGRNKQFLITPFGEEEPIGQKSCEDFWYDLDLMIPGTGRFSALIDPRKDHAFDYIALTTADLLRPLSRTQETTRTYLSKDYTVSQIGTVNYIGEIGSRLVVEQTGKKSSLLLSSTAPLDLKNTRVIEHFEYKFEPNNKKPTSGHVSLSLMSAGLSRNELNDYLKKTQASISASHIGEYALELLNNDLPTGH
jgi:hypothetical protein